MTGNPDNVSRNADIQTERWLSMSFAKLDGVYDTVSVPFLNFEYSIFIFIWLFHLISI